MNSCTIKPDADLYFITTSIVEWQDVFVSVPLYTDIIQNLQYCCTNKGLHLHGYVIIPNHAQFIVSTESLAQLFDIFTYFKMKTSQNITALLEEMNRYEVLEILFRAEKHEERGNRHNIWENGFHPVAIERGSLFQQKLDSLHENPVRKGFVERPELWRWSSARNYILNDHGLIQIECI